MNFSKKTKISNKKLNVLIFLLFAVISFIAAIVFIQYGRIGMRNDGSFHFSRAEEVFQNLKSGSFFTYIATHTFHNSGVANFLFYPTVFLYPWAILRFIFNPISAFYVWYGLMMFITMCISYYSLNVLLRNKLRSIFFALLYTFSSYHLMLGASNYVLGEFIAYTFLPLTFAGIFNILWGKGNKWYLLPIGLSLVAYSHLLSLAICVGLLSIIFLLKLLFDFKNISKPQIVKLFKAAILTALLSIWIIIPFLTDFINGDIFTPISKLTYIKTLSQTINFGLDNSFSTVLGLLLTIVLFIGGWFVKKNKIELNIYLFGSTIILISTSLFPWIFFENTPISIIQFPYRLTSYAILFLAVTASFVLEELFNYSQLRDAPKVLIVTVVILIGYLGTISPKVETIRHKNEFYSNISKQTINRIDDNTQFDKNNYEQMFNYSVKWGEFDYYHRNSFDTDTCHVDDQTDTDALNELLINDKKSHSIYQHVVKVTNDKDQIIKPKIKPNSLTFKVKGTKDSYIDLPVVAYKNTLVTNNNHKVDYQLSNRGTVQIKADKGLNSIIVSYKPRKIFYIAFAIAIITWISLISILIINRLKRN